MPRPAVSTTAAHMARVTTVPVHATAGGMVSRVRSRVVSTVATRTVRVIYRAMDPSATVIAAIAANRVARDLRRVSAMPSQALSVRIVASATT